MAALGCNSVRIFRTFSSCVGTILKTRNVKFLNQHRRYLKTQVTVSFPWKYVPNFHLVNKHFQRKDMSFWFWQISCDTAFNNEFWMEHRNNTGIHNTFAGAGQWSRGILLTLRFIKSNLCNPNACTKWSRASDNSTLPIHLDTHKGKKKS